MTELNSYEIERLEAEIRQLRAEKIEQEQEWAAICAERERPLRAEIERLRAENAQLAKNRPV